MLVAGPKQSARTTPLVVGCLGLLIWLSGCGPTSFLITPVSASRELDERVIIRENPWATQKVVLLDIDGVLKNGRERSLTGVVGENPVALFKEKLDRAAGDRRVRAVVVRINSPGGSVTASDLMYTELSEFRQRSGKPVIASMLDVAASGGYYVACAADRIYAHPTTITGSIGVVMMSPEFTGTMELLGVRMNVFKSGDLKDAGSMFRTMTDEDRALFAGLIARMYERFVDVVRAARPEIPAEHLAGLCDGRVFLGPTAKEEGLVDEVGTIQDALRAAKEAAGLADEAVLVVQYSRPLAHRPNVYAQAGDVPAQVNLINVELGDWLTSPSPQFLYLWAPAW